VISSYLVANEETARRGIVLSFVSALVQSLIAVLIVGIGAWLLNVTAKTMCGAERVIEIASYALIAGFGVRLVWTKGGGLIRALQSSQGKSEPRLAPVLAHAAAIQRHHGHHSYGHGDHGHHHHAHAPATQTSLPIMCLDTRMLSITITAMSTTSIADIPMVPSRRNSPVPAAGGAVSARFSPSASGPVRAPFWFWCSRWRRGCSGAGIAATFVMGLGTAITVAAIAILAVSAKGLARRIGAGREGGGALLMRGVEFGAAGLVLLFGVGLLLGYIAAERVTCF